MAAKALWTDLRCNRCHAMMAKGVLVRGSTVANVRHDVCPAVVMAPRSETATERQVAYTIDLQASSWTPAVLGGRRYSREQLTAMSKLEISQIIDALVSERDLQGC